MPVVAAARLMHRSAALCAAALLAGCASSGGNFDETGLNMLTPGQTTYAETVDALGAMPSASWRQSDGTVLAQWAFKLGAYAADTAYYRKEAMLQFGPDGRLLRLVDTTNILLEPWKRRQLLGAGTGSAMMP